MAAVWRVLSALQPRCLHTACGHRNSNRTSVTHLRRQVYGRLYPLLLVRTDGSTIHIRYKEPKRILMLPVDSSTLPEAERKARLRRQFPSKLRAKQEEALEELDLEKYKKFWKNTPSPCSAHPEEGSGGARTSSAGRTSRQTNSARTTWETL